MAFWFISLSLPCSSRGAKFLPVLSISGTKAVRGEGTGAVCNGAGDHAARACCEPLGSGSSPHGRRRSLSAQGTVTLTRLDVEGEFVHSLLIASAREVQGDGEGLPTPHHELPAAHLRRPVLPAVALALQVPRLQHQICKGSSRYGFASATCSGPAHAAPALGQEELLSPPPRALGFWTVVPGFGSPFTQAALSCPGAPGTAPGTAAVPGSEHPSRRAPQAGLASHTVSVLGQGSCWQLSLWQSAAHLTELCVVCLVLWCCPSRCHHGSVRCQVCGSWHPVLE